MSEKSVSVVIEKGFKYAFRGCDVVEFKAGKDAIDVAEEVAELAIQQKWARKARSVQASKALPGAPENKAEGDQE